MEKFDQIYQRACQRKGGIDQLEARLSDSLSYEEIASIDEAQWLSAFSMKVFQCGISWSLVRKKWPDFDELFFNFNIEPLLMLSDEHWDNKASNPKIIRHHAKVMTIKHNADMIYQARFEHGSFGELAAKLASQDITQLWRYLKSHGKR